MERVVTFSWFSNRPEVPLEQDKKPSSGITNCDWNGLIRLLAFNVGINCCPVDNNKRILNYMKSLTRLSQESYFAQLFKQDPIVTAKFFLKQRDELKWYVDDFRLLGSISDRLKNFADAELNVDKQEIRGIPDIYQELFASLKEKPNINLSIFLQEDERLYPGYVRHLLDLLPNCGVNVITAPSLKPIAYENTNLLIFQNQLIKLINGEAPLFVPFIPDDCSLKLFKSRYATDANEELSEFLEIDQNDNWYILRDSSDLQVAETIVLTRGTKAEIDSDVSSLPVIQVLQSFCNLIWKPMDVEAVFEFLNLPLKPFPKTLAEILGKALLDAPGINSTIWTEKLDGYWNNFDTSNEEGKDKFVKESNRYKWWFEQELFDPELGAPLQLMINRISWLEEWATSNANVRNDNEEGVVFDELARLCSELTDLINIISENGLVTRFQLEKLLSLVLENRKIKTQQYSKYSSGIQQDLSVSAHIDNMIWWDFSNNWESIDTPDFLWQDEIEKLKKAGKNIFGKKDASKLLRYGMVRKILSVKEHLILSYSQYHGSAYNFPHSFWLFVESFGEEYCTENILINNICPEAYVSVKKSPLLTVNAEIKVEGLEELVHRDKESYSSLSNLIYYPHIYLFENILGLRNWLRGSLKLDSTLKGSIIHKFAERALNDKELLKGKLSRDKWKEWCDLNIQDFIDREAALLNKSKYSVEKVIIKNWMNNLLFNLLEAITHGDWKVENVEYAFEKQFRENTLLSGRTDLVLKKEGSRLVVDLKSGGSSYKENEITSNADWQLLLYSYFGHQGTDQADSAFFIIQEGQLIGRNNPGIMHFNVVKPKPDNELSYDQMLHMLKEAITIRKGQFIDGLIEFRINTETIGSLSEKLDNIQMKKEANKFDDFTFLNTI